LLNFETKIRFLEETAFLWEFLEIWHKTYFLVHFYQSGATVFYADW
jgi:hypothetical protein